MKENKRTKDCYIASYQIPNLDPYLKQNGFFSGMILFAIPDFGIQFRCRADGQHIDLEFAAFFSLLDFAQNDLSAEKIKSILVYSSHPEFIFAFTGDSKHMPARSARFKKVQEYYKKIKTAISYIRPTQNRALMPAADYPTVPDSAGILLPKASELNKSSFGPWRKGLRL